MTVHYPSITNDEFAQACKQLQDRCASHADDSDWVKVTWTGNELKIQQRRALAQEPQKHQDEEPENVEFDECDLESVSRHSTSPSPDIMLDFSITLSSTYQVPVLWFNFSSKELLPGNGLDQIYDFVVAPSSKDGLRQIGVLGGISLDYHPQSDVPEFFVHPCRTQEVLETVRPSTEVTPFEYLMLWFGIIGSAVGLTVPLAAMAGE